MKTPVLAAVLAGSVLLPAAAQAGTSSIPPVPAGVNPCVKVENEYRASVALARQAKQTAYRAAQARFHSATSDERTQVQASNGLSRRIFLASTADERAERRDARAAARSAYIEALRAAQAQKRAGLRSCR